MNQLRLPLLFGSITIVCVVLFTSVVFNGYVKATNQQDLNYLHLYTEHISKALQLGKAKQKIELPSYAINNKIYQTIIYKHNGEMEYWLSTSTWVNPLIKQFPFAKLKSLQPNQGQLTIEGQRFNWIKVPIIKSKFTVFVVHQQINHWPRFKNIFGTPIIILGLILFWAAIWSAIILSRLFKHEHDKNDLLQCQAIEICQTRDEAYAASQAKSRFLANISHELRTPLTAILGFSENMLDSNDPCNSQSVPLQTIIRNGHYLLQVINELLDLSKVDEGKLQIECIDFSAVHLLQDVELLMQQQAENKGLEFKINYSWPLPETIKSDPFRIKQVLLNLSSNAIKFTHHGYVHINVSCQRNEELVRFEVLDTGIGIAPELHDRIFQPFNQADKSTTRQYGGSGLGLSLSKRFSELMGGSIELASEADKGSRFTVTLPSGPLSNVKFISDLSKHTLPSATEFKPVYTQLKGQILVADDAPDNRLLISILLKKLGLQVTIVENGQLVLDALANNSFDLILLDIQMPVLDGIQTIIQLRKQLYDKPVIALTANTLAEDRKICHEAGFTDFIAKPIRFQMLSKILSQYFDEA